ncbi:MULTISPECIES: 1-(5-phosphoribosyl)-5-[(5-phosphoribosylamino)methylideneamino]imidazole-4-carboxamide isomerase [Methanocorpusculum]|jgi:phosphoribosylformimino-5-aminoimidazole carboxamide ribotide isomerase|uniref:1-(5-phosphoribosyl)-5-[(5-phosphoribosylamino)methylideneamino] imidazole-4-carboxamide isomerase n=1 Tax=Methanocorpusculum parvum TaxID=2193 RepID=A0AAX0Q6J5_9EURY|nr:MULTISPECIES: 1-(5-phosphoribosyl)-5-[(5-phosphoribosylamino)methylideneamino]imidazole-4-carboxamide isomerase [Methanocorpusculum]MDD2803351.1 1-(5-phosphoribosyl)-5-[(5-phosphoribosylamino)methylideneamino]imidazole-4-carboxamide isomerase [Methanocorpusculum sp.]MEA5086406.1 1-(5-phosphoribosyl)-5-[(5-phosphoribosylamino)methylideneamino]imidazole-4-carboxamide isomerase [Methanocorpusculum sp.]NLC91452.1 1-(5-phosphoribosyl)-5-[(5-phosphoribosylamino)methylideneamino]imidazole-4-carboxam
MEVFPAVDILSGNCVQLVGGDRLTATVYGSPIDNARRWIAEGAANLHVVNLDGAFAASSTNAAMIREVVEMTDVFVQVGGGIRSLEDARGWLNCGVSRIILSTFATQDPAVIRTLSQEFGSERIMAGVDARNGEIAVSGWQELAGDFIGWAEKFEELGAGSLLYTNVDVEGKQAGIDRAPVQKLLDAVSIPVVIAGGVSSSQDVRSLKELGASGCVLGSSLYSGKITLKEALEAAL